MKKRKTIRTHVAITTEGWYYLGMLAFIVAGAMIRDINLLYIMAGMMMGPLIFSWYASTKSLRRISIERRFQSLASVNDPLYVEMNVSKPAGMSRAIAVVVKDRVLRDGAIKKAATETELLFPVVNSGGTASASYRATMNQRGRYQLGPLKVSTSMPVGLVRVTKTIDDEEAVLVSPQIGILSSAWSRHLEFKSDGGQKSARRRGNAEGDFYGMREWRNGDGRNRIHWRTSAKRNKLIVRQYEQRVNQDLVVILDLFRSASTATKAGVGVSQTGSHRADIEKAISFVATLIIEHCKQGSTHVVAASASLEGFEISGTASPVFRQELMERLAMVEPSRDDRLPQSLSDVLPKVGVNARIVVVSTMERDFSDTEKFGKVWENAAIRRSSSDIVGVNVKSAEFSNWFQLLGDKSTQDLNTVDSSASPNVGSVTSEATR